jgi:hypothetical protein
LGAAANADSHFSRGCWPITDQLKSTIVERAASMLKREAAESRIHLPLQSKAPSGAEDREEFHREQVGQNFDERQTNHDAKRQAHQEDEELRDHDRLFVLLPQHD